MLLSLLQMELYQYVVHMWSAETRLYYNAKHCGPLKARLTITLKSQFFLPFFQIQIVIAAPLATLASQQLPTYGNENDKTQRLENFKKFCT